MVDDLAKNHGMVKLGYEYKSPGFSLVELMITLAIVGILAAVSIPAYFNHLNKSRQSVAIGTLMQIKAAQEIYVAENGWSTTNISQLEGFTTAGTYYISEYYKYEITAAGTMRAHGDLNSDGNFCDIWDANRDMDKPVEIDPSTLALADCPAGADEGFSFGGMLGSIF